jgi:simple sugar transport system ATP-binding protein
MPAPVLELRNIAKEYYGNRVLKGVSLQVRPGTIHALVGENGAGKSTLMNVLFGMAVIRDTGGYRARCCSKASKCASRPRRRMQAGIGMAPESLIPRGMENIKLNREPRPNVLSRVFGLSSSASTASAAGSIRARP